MRLARILRPAAAGALLAMGAAAPLPVQQGGGELRALRDVERGQWQLRDHEGRVSDRCLRNPASLIQLRHANAQCSHFVVENSARVATIHYTCPGHGHGRTSITVETPRLMRIETQGVFDGAPFSLELEGRRTGACR